MPNRTLGCCLCILLFLPSVCCAPKQPRRDNDVRRMLHLTDFHVDPEYSSPSGRVSLFCHRDNNTTKGPATGEEAQGVGKFGDRRCDAPESLLDYVLAEAARIVPKPDLIIWTGDNTPHVEYNTTDYVFNSVKSASDRIRHYFADGTTSIIPTLGNHDFVPANFIPDRPNELYERIYGLWADWIGDERQRENFRKGGFYSFERNGQTFIVLNTNIYYIFNHQTLAQHDDPAGQFAFLRVQLEKAKSRNVKVHLVGHIPPGAFEREHLKLMPRAYNEKLLELMEEYAPWTKWLIFGHLHTDTFRILKDKEGNPVQMLFVSAAVSPLRTNNPAFRVYEYAEETMDLLDIKTYFVDLDRLNKEGGGTPMDLEYSMRGEYKLEALEPKAFGRLLERLKADEGLFGRYMLYNSVQSNRTAPSQWERGLQLCAIEFMGQDNYEKCLKAYDSSQPNSAKSNPTIDGIALSFVLLCALFTLLGGSFAV